MHIQFRIFPVSLATNSYSLLELGRYAVHREDSMCTHYMKHTDHCVLNLQRGLGGVGDFAVTCGYIPQFFPRLSRSSSLSVLQERTSHCVHRKNHRSCGNTGPCMPRCVSCGHPFSALLRGTYKVFCLTGGVFMCVHVCRYTYPYMLCAGYSCSCTYVWRPEVNIRYCLIKLYTFENFYFMCMYVYVNVHVCR